MNRLLDIFRNNQAAFMVALLVMANTGIANEVADVTPATFFLKAPQIQAMPGSTVSVDVFIKDAVDVGSYQLCLKGQTSTGQHLTLSSIVVNKSHKTFLFGSEQVVEAKDYKDDRLAVVTFGAGVSVAGNEQRYLATFIFEVPEDAQGTLHIKIDEGKETMLLHGSGLGMTFAVGKTINIQLVDEDKMRSLKRGRATR